MKKRVGVIESERQVNARHGDILENTLNSCARISLYNNSSRDQPSFKK